MNSINGSEKLLKNCKVVIGDVGISIRSDDQKLAFALGEHHTRYLSDKRGEGIDIRYKRGRIPDLSGKKKLFDSGGVWSLYADEGKGYIITFNSPLFGNEPYKAAYFNSDYTIGEVIIRNDIDGKMVEDVSVINPFDYPLDELMVVNYLSRRNGIILHSCFIRDNGRGMIFSGTSGAGKSTMANIWKERGEGRIFTDERIIIREKSGGALIAYGTPWHGTAGIDLPESSSVDRIFFLKHESSNKAEKLSSGDTFSRLVVRSFPTYWDSTGMSCTLSLISKIVSSVPAYELGFYPDGNVIDYVRSID